MKLCSYILNDKQRYCKNYKYNNSKYCFQHYTESSEINFSYILFYLNIIITTGVFVYYIQQTTKPFELKFISSGLENVHNTTITTAITNISSSLVHSSNSHNNDDCDILSEFYYYILYYLNLQNEYIRFNFDSTLNLFSNILN
jgi:hypothetical protein